MRINLKDRFESKCIPEPMSGCWIWIAGYFDVGYGACSYKGRNEGAHRVAWKLYRGDIPKGIYVLHKCDNMSCVNPDHLFIGTQKDNVSDMISKGRYTSPMALKTHCKKGHPLVQKKTQRMCRICANEANRKYKLRVKIFGSQT